MDAIAPAIDGSQESLTPVSLCPYSWSVPTPVNTPTPPSDPDGEFFREGFYNAAKPTAALVDENGGSPIPIAVLYCTPSHLVLGGAPAGTTGVKFLKITAGYGDEPFTICPDPITPG